MSVSVGSFSGHGKITSGEKITEKNALAFDEGDLVTVGERKAELDEAVRKAARGRAFENGIVNFFVCAAFIAGGVFFIYKIWGFTDTLADNRRSDNIFLIAMLLFFVGLLLYIIISSVRGTVNAVLFGDAVSGGEVFVYRFTVRNKTYKVTRTSNSSKRIYYLHFAGVMVKVSDLEYRATDIGCDAFCAVFRKGERDFFAYLGNSLY